jgi:hypothetical protein
MDRDLANRLSCVVCGIETKRHAGWFLVMENCWLDRVRVLSWPPVLAREGRMRGVCGKQHLKTLVTHWLNNANLQLVAGGHLPGRLRSTSVNAGPTTLPSPWGKVLGELAVQRESLSHRIAGSEGVHLECPDRWD